MGEESSSENYDVFTSSFRQFLGLLAETRKRMSSNPSNGSATDVDPSIALLASRKWKSFQGKIYIKLHRRRIAELEASGLANVADLFLALTVMAQSHEEEKDYVKKFCGFVRDVDKLDVGKLALFCPVVSFKLFPILVKNFFVPLDCFSIKCLLMLPSYLVSSRELQFKPILTLFPRSR